MEPLADVVERVLHGAGAARADWIAHAATPGIDAVGAAPPPSTPETDRMTGIGIEPAAATSAGTDSAMSARASPAPRDRLALAVAPALAPRPLDPAAGSSPNRALAPAMVAARSGDPIAGLAPISAGPAMRGSSAAPGAAASLSPPVAPAPREPLLALASAPNPAAPMRDAVAWAGSSDPLRGTEAATVPGAMPVGPALVWTLADPMRTGGAAGSRTDPIAPGGSALPPAPVAPEDRGPIRVVVVNGRDLAQGVAGHMAAGLDQPQAGLTGPDPRLSPWGLAS